MSFDNFKWFFGVVEQVEGDPVEIGRVKVRPHVLYNNDKDVLPTDRLPWAIVLQDLSSSDKYTSLKIGQTVFGFFADGEDCQVPVIMSKLPGTDFSTDKVYNDLPFLVREDVEVEQDQRYQEYQNKKNNTTKKVPIALSTQTWNEPDNPRSTNYTDNKAEITTSGHVFEVDDTEEHERIHTHHKSGTFEEYHPDGSKVTRITKDNYQIIAGSDFVKVTGSVNLTIDTNVNMKIKKDWNVEVGGNVTMDVKGNFDLDAKRIDLN